MALPKELQKAIYGNNPVTGSTQSPNDSMTSAGNVFTGTKSVITGEGNHLRNNIMSALGKKVDGSTHKRDSLPTDSDNLKDALLGSLKTESLSFISEDMSPPVSTTVRRNLSDHVGHKNSALKEPDKDPVTTPDTHQPIHNLWQDQSAADRHTGLRYLFRQNTGLGSGAFTRSLMKPTNFPH